MGSQNLPLQLHPCWPQLLHRLTEIGVIHGLLGSQPLLMVISQQLVQEVKDFRTDQVSVLTVDEVLPALPGMPAKGPAVTALHYPHVPW